jgi:hypothetical protein
MAIETTLPKNFTLYKELNHSRQSPAYFIINMLTALLFLLFFQLLSQVAAAMRTDFDGASIGGLRGWAVLGVFLLAFVMMFVHEALHLVTFWAFTGVKPTFSVTGLVPRTVVPSLYLPKGMYLLIKATPLVLLTGAYLALLPYLPLSWLMFSFFFFAGNIAYSASDLWAMVETVKAPRGALVEDVGEFVRLFSDKQFIARPPTGTK